MNDNILNKIKICNCWCHCYISIPHLKLMLCHCFLQIIGNRKYLLILQLFLCFFCFIVFYCNHFTLQFSNLVHRQRTRNRWANRQRQGIWQSGSRMKIRPGSSFQGKEKWARNKKEVTGWRPETMWKIR